MGRGCSGSLPHEVSPLPHAITRPHARPSLAFVAVALLSAMFLFTVSAVADPGAVLGASSTKVCCLRRQPSGQSVDDGEAQGDRQQGHQGHRHHERVGWQVEGPLCRRGPLGARMVADQRDQRQERQVAVRRALRLRRTEAVQGGCAADRDQVRRLQRPSPDEPLHRCDPRGHHRRRHPRVHRGHGERRRLEYDVCRGRRVRVVVVPDHGRRRHERPDALRRGRRVCRERPVQGDGHDPGGPDPAPRRRRRPTADAHAASDTLPGTTEGIDISHWQGTIDWTKVAGAASASRT